MTISTGASSPPTQNVPLALLRFFLIGGAIGGSIAALVVGWVIGNARLFAAGSALPVVGGLLLLAFRVRRARKEEAVGPRTALAMIESLQAVKDETSEASVRFDLSVVPDGEPGHRVAIQQNVNLVDLPDYRPRGVVVVQYPPDRPWRVRIVKRPTPAWQERAATAQLDSVPGPATVIAPPEGCGHSFMGLLGLLLAAAAVVLPFRADLFDGAESPKPSVTSTTTTTTTTTTTVVSSGSGTVALGPGQSFLDKGELERSLGSLTGGGDKGQALTVVVQERLLSVVFSPAGTQAPGFDPRTLPFDRFPALVEEARSTLGVRSPQTWQITAERLTGPLVLRIVVTGAEGTASLEADGRGAVVRRTPAR